MNPDIYCIAFATFAATSFSVLVRRRYRLLWPRPTPSDTPPATAVAELIAFSKPGYKGVSREFSQSERDLTRQDGDFIVQSVLVMAGNWNLHSELDHRGIKFSLNEDGGPDADGSYPDPSHWGGNAPFPVRSIQLSSPPSEP